MCFAALTVKVGSVKISKYVCDESKHRSKGLGERLQKAHRSSKHLLLESWTHDIQSQSGTDLRSEERAKALPRL
jgi:hypothetical protein